MDYRKLYQSRDYDIDIENVANCVLPWDELSNRTMLITGATGMIGSCLIDVIMRKNITDSINCTVFALGRSKAKFDNRFKEHLENVQTSQYLKFVEHDINTPYSDDELGEPDYILHLASNTHPVAYATDPIGTITSNILGMYYLLEYASKHGCCRVLLASSNEIYGENRGDVELFSEDYCGYINSNTMRAGYPESKRCAEALCQAYIAQNDLDVVIARLTRSYGPTMLDTDTKAISQFIKKGVNRENIVLKSEGNQFYSYTYVSDAVYGLLTVLLSGRCGEAYNIADVSSDITLKNLACVIASYVGTEVVFEIPDRIESAGYSKATKARLDGSRIKDLGWTPRYDIASGIQRTIDILRTN